MEGMPERIWILPSIGNPTLASPAFVMAVKGGVEYVRVDVLEAREEHERQRARYNATHADINKARRMIEQDSKLLRQVKKDRDAAKRRLDALEKESGS